VSEAISIREAQPGDADRLALVGGATFLETFAGVLGGSAIVEHCRVNHCSSYYAKALENGCRAFLAEVEPDGAPVGFALTGMPDLPGTGEGDLELKRIYVLSRFHGSGVGAALLECVTGAAAAYRRLVLGVYAANERAQRFYKRNGFVPIGTRRFDVGGALYDDVIFARGNS